jgi:hypothetical protein
MNFKTAKISEKLRFLAAALRKPRLQKVFNQYDILNCVCGLGSRLASNGRLSRKWRGSRDLIARYGLTFKEADALLTSTYSELRIGVKDARDYEAVTASFAANVLDKLANKYERKGN